MKVAMAVALLLIAACGGGDGDGVAGTYSCRAAFPGADGGAGMLAVCLDASGGSTQDMANNRQQCIAQGNTFSSEACPHMGALGGCRQTATAAPGAVLTTWYYADGSSTAADIQMLCDGLASIAPPSLMIEFVLP
jgi:hypothetical protein